MKINQIRLCLIIVWALAMTGCTGHLIPETAAPEDGSQDRQFVIVTAASQDTLASLARKHLNDESKAWQIAAYNDIETLKPGERVVIPLVPPVLGGIGPDGYQIVPVLLYTRLAKQPTNAHTVSTRKFHRQMQYLDEHGFNTVSLDWLSRFFQFREQPPAKAIVISFDSSQQWVHDIAYPVLKNRGMAAALFIRPDEIGREGNLTWQQVSKMAAGGFDIGVLGSAAGPTGAQDPRSRLRAVEAGLAEPIRAFKKHLKLNCRYYAYPMGLADDLFIALLKRHGYQSAFTRIRGGNPFFSDAFNVRRSLIYGHYDMDQFLKNLTTFHKTALR